MSSKAYLLIADITGYTSYLTETELDHARSTLQDLLNVIFEEIREPMKVAKLEGDAVLAYAPDTRVGQGQTLIDMVEVIYGAFRKALELMVINTTCQCNACRSIGSLDLKFFVHHGEYREQKVGPFVELVGTDVNVVHRLTKNTVKDVLGLEAYAMYTRAAISASGLETAAMQFHKHAESYEHVGEIETHVQDLSDSWARLKSKVRIELAPEDVLFEVETHIALPQASAWEYLTDPHVRALLNDSDTGRVDLVGGLITEGAVYHCAHGDDHVELMVVDWRPFDQYTYKVDYTDDLFQLSRLSFEAEGEGSTKLTVQLSRVRGGEPDARAALEAKFADGRAFAEAGIERVLAYIDSEQAKKAQTA